MNRKLSRSYTDCLKIISAMLVVIGHYASACLAHGCSSSPIWWALASQCGYIGVAIFFFLSGYGLSESDMNHHLQISDFVRKRFLKIYKPVLLITIFWLVVKYLFMNGCWSLHSIYDIFWGFDDCVLWFVKILFGLYASFFVFSVFYQKEQKVIAWGFLITASLVLMYIAHILEGYSSIAIPLFALGVLYSRENKSFLLIVALCIAFCCGFVYSFATKDNHGIHAAINYLCVAAAILFYNYVPIGGRVKEVEYRPLFWGATISFDLYLTHMKVIETLVYNKCHFGGG